MEEHNQSKPEFHNKDINIVLVGETGAGKSTLINALVNYLKYGTLIEAQRSELHCLIYSKFTLTDDHLNSVTVSMGENDNESNNVVESSTQTAKSYVFRYDKINIRLIDTPGIGDTRGTVKDEENFDQLLLKLSELTHIHAFCFVMKPDNPKLTVHFEYCIKQILSRLDKSASENIVFVFTYSRSTFYKPGATINPLRVLRADIANKPPHVIIPFKIENVFCMDNEAFRFLLGSKRGISFTDEEKKDFRKSWEHSVIESMRLLDYVMNLEPHKMQNTTSINEARRLILNVSVPLAFVTMNINDNLQNIKKKEDELQDETKTIQELKKILHFDMIVLEVENIDHPRTVCTNPACTETLIIEGSKHINYKQICHEPCYMSNVPKEVVGSTELKKCDAFGKKIFKRTSNCIKCTHSYKEHMHIYFTTRASTTRIINEEVDKDIKNREQIVEEIENVIKALHIKKKTLKKESEIVERTMAEFTYFLRNNAISPFNDKYEEYIHYLINREKSQTQSVDWNLIAIYEKLIASYNEYKKRLDTEMQGNRSSEISAEYILKLVEQLYNLEINGQLIKSFYESQQAHRRCEALVETNVDTVGFYRNLID